MNASEFNTELGKLINRAMSEGIGQRKLSPIELVGSLDCQKADVQRHFQDLARRAAEPTILPFNGRIPPPRQS